MKYSIKTKKYLYFIILILSIILVLNIIRQYNGSQLNNISEQIIFILDKDKKIGFLGHDAIGIGFYCQIGDTRRECVEIMKQYETTLNKIPKGVFFYRCENVIIRTDYWFYEVYPDDSLYTSGVRFNLLGNGWLHYHHGPKKQESDPCYPWNDLEDYWERYGKASPEEIQAVIDGKN